MEINQDGVVITDGISRLKLTSAGPPQHFFPIRIEVASGPYSAVVDAEVLGYADFRDALTRLHETLTGQASLRFAEGISHSLALIGDGRGGIEVRAKIGDGRMPPKAFLTVGMILDQSYLPQITRAINREFRLTS